VTGNESVTNKSLRHWLERLAWPARKRKLEQERQERVTQNLLSIGRKLGGVYRSNRTVLVSWRRSLMLVNVAEGVACFVERTVPEHEEQAERFFAAVTQTCPSLPHIRDSAVAQALFRIAVGSDLLETNLEELRGLRKGAERVMAQAICAVLEKSLAPQLV
jgi:hypothetical protein